MTDDMVEKVARAICKATGSEWRIGTYEVASGKNFEIEDHPLDPANNHWRHKATAALQSCNYDLALKLHGWVKVWRRAVARRAFVAGMGRVFATKPFKRIVARMLVGSHAACSRSGSEGGDVTPRTAHTAATKRATKEPTERG